MNFKKMFASKESKPDGAGAAEQQQRAKAVFSTDSSSSMYSRVILPPLQVVNINGRWFSLDDNLLLMYKTLKKNKLITSVPITVVSLEAVPPGIQAMMAQRAESRNLEYAGTSSRRRRGPVSDHDSLSFSSSPSESDDHCSQPSDCETACQASKTVFLSSRSILPQSGAPSVSENSVSRSRRPRRGAARSTKRACSKQRLSTATKSTSSATLRRTDSEDCCDGDVSSAND